MWFHLHFGTGGFSTSLASSPAGTALPRLSESVVPGAPVRIQGVRAIPRLLPFTASWESALGTGAFQQLRAALAESRHPQAQTLLLDSGNCCLRDRFAYKYPSFSLWLSRAGEEKGSLLVQSLPGPAEGAHPSSPPNSSCGGETPTPMSAGWQIPAGFGILQLSLLPAQPPLQAVVGGGSALQPLSLLFSLGGPWWGPCRVEPHSWQGNAAPALPRAPGRGHRAPENRESRDPEGSKSGNGVGNRGFCCRRNFGFQDGSCNL